MSSQMDNETYNLVREFERNTQTKVVIVYSKTGLPISFNRVNIYTGEVFKH